MSTRAREAVDLGVLAGDVSRQLLEDPALVFGGQRRDDHLSPDEVDDLHQPLRNGSIALGPKSPARAP